MKDSSYSIVNFSSVNKQIFLFKSLYSPELNFDLPRHLRARVWKLLLKSFRKQTRCFWTAGLAEHVLCSSISKSQLTFPSIATATQHSSDSEATVTFLSKCLLTKRTEPQQPKEGNIQYNSVSFFILFWLILTMLFLMLLTGTYELLGLTNAPSNTTFTTGISRTGHDISLAGTPFVFFQQT